MAGNSWDKLFREGRITEKAYYFAGGQLPPEEYGMHRNRVQQTEGRPFPPKRPPAPPPAPPPARPRQARYEEPSRRAAPPPPRRATYQEDGYREPPRRPRQVAQRDPRDERIRDLERRVSGLESLVQELLAAQIEVEQEEEPSYTYDDEDGEYSSGLEGFSGGEDEGYEPQPPRRAPRRIREVREIIPDEELPPEERRAREARRAHEDREAAALGVGLPPPRQPEEEGESSR